MRVLFLAPQPFYQERGTPIAVRLALEALSRKFSATPGMKIDLLTYSEGAPISIQGVTIHRIPTPGFLRGIRPGISCRKLICDLIFLVSTFSMLWRARNSPYNVIHAVEESVFIAWLAKHLFGVPYIYDMDSSLALQLTEKWWLLRPLLPILRGVEGLAVRGSVAVAPVCDALEAIAHRHGSRHTVMLRDVSLLPAIGAPQTDTANDPRKEIGAGPGIPVIMYVGNLESYQGIDLLLEAFARLANHPSKPILAIVGGVPATIVPYQEKAAKLGCSASTVFLGPRPVGNLQHYLAASDILVSPRIKGNNTPMKIYSYMHSGRPLVATDLPTHRQVLDTEVALLADAKPEPFADAIRALLDDPEARRELGVRAFERAERLYTIQAFEAQLYSLYERVEQSIADLRPDSTLAVRKEA